MVLGDDQGETESHWVDQQDHLNEANHSALIEMLANYYQCYYDWLNEVQKGVLLYFDWVTILYLFVLEHRISINMLDRGDTREEHPTFSRSSLS